MLKTIKMKHSSVFLLFFTVLFLGQLTQPANSDSVAKSKLLEKSLDSTKAAVQTSEKSNSGDIHTDKIKSPIAENNNSTTNSTVKCEDGSNNCTENKTLYNRIINGITNNKAMLIRTMYVLIALTSIVVIYFMVRSFRLRHKRNKSRKYGLITAPSDLEMAPLDQDDEDEDDMTVFELNGGHKR